MSESILFVNLLTVVFRVFLLINSFYLPGQLHHGMLPGRSVPDDQLHSGNKISPDFQSSKKNSLKEQVPGEFVFICDMLCLAVFMRGSMTTLLK